VHDPTPRPLLCDRTREWVALRLDGDLSEFETALMTAHLERCASCRAFRIEVEAITAGIRSAPFVPLPRPTAVPQPRPVPARRVQLLVAAVVVLAAAALGGLLGTLRGSPPERGVAAPIRAPMVASLASDPLLRDIRLTSLRQSTVRSLGASKPVLRATA
jgi:ferric-dicitrate binding protein FerR (iron transport regulator)